MMIGRKSEISFILKYNKSIEKKSGSIRNVPSTAKGNSFATSVAISSLIYDIILVDPTIATEIAIRVAEGKLLESKKSNTERILNQSIVITGNIIPYSSNPNKKLIVGFPLYSFLASVIFFNLNTSLFDSVLYVSPTIREYITMTDIVISTGKTI